MLIRKAARTVFADFMAIVHIKDVKMKESTAPVRTFGQQGPAIPRFDARFAPRLTPRAALSRS